MAETYVDGDGEDKRQRCETVTTETYLDGDGGDERQRCETMTTETYSDSGDVLGW